LSLPTSLEDVTAMREFEEKIRAMPPKMAEAYIYHYLDVLHAEAEDIAKVDVKGKLSLLQEAISIFVAGSKKPEPKTIKKLQEIFTIVFYLVGDASWDEPNIRFQRAVLRRAKLYNIFRAAVGVEDLKPPELETAGEVTREYIEVRLNFLREQIVLLENALAEMSAPGGEEGKEKVIKLDD